MCDQTEIVYEDGEVVWVKLGPTWWPGQVLDLEKAPPDALSSFRKPPIAVVKFFKEEALEFVKNYNQIYKYNCSRKHEFIRKGLDQYRGKHPNMELFPSYVCEAETLTHGDPDIIHSDEFKPVQKVDYNAIFSTGIEKKPKLKTISPKLEDSPKITHPRILQKYLKGTSDYKAHILVQEPQNDGVDEIRQLEPEEETMVPPPAPTPPRTPATPGPLTCYACSYTCNRIGVMVLHNKIHSAGYVPYTPQKKPKVRLPHSTPKIKLFSSKKSRGRPKKMSLPDYDSLSLPTKAPKYVVKASPVSAKRKTKSKEIEKPKTDVEIKNSLLADWSESSNDSLDILSSVNLCERPRPAASPGKSPQPDLDEDKKSVSDDGTDCSLGKPVGTRKADCFDFDDDDDEELAIESISRKIPRLSAKSDETPRKVLDLNAELDAGKSTYLPVEEEKMDVDLDSKINNLLQETKLADLPSLPSEPKLVQEKEPSHEESCVEEKKEGVKPQQKTIFKTKTFFRSRHSRSQDAIEKYVADNTSVDKPPTYMEGSEQPENPSDVSSVLTPPSKGSQTKTPKFAPKIQLKKLKAALSEQIKPQTSSKSIDDKWDNESLDKLINSADSGSENYVVAGDFLGTIEEPSELLQNIPTEPNHKSTSELIDSKRLKEPDEIKTGNILESGISDYPIVSDETKSVLQDQVLSATNVNALQPIFGSSETNLEPKGAGDLHSTSPVGESSIKTLINTKATSNSPSSGSEFENKLVIQDLPSDKSADDTKKRTLATKVESITNVKTLNTPSIHESVVPEETSKISESSARDNESVLQIAETLINLPVTSMEFSHNTEETKMSESDKNISAAKSLVQMSESMQHEHPTITTETSNISTKKFDAGSASPGKKGVGKPITTSPFKNQSPVGTKLFKILDESFKPKPAMKVLNSLSGDNVSNFSHGKSSPPSKPRVIIRKGTPQKESKTPIILPLPNKMELPKDEEALFDINSMPIVLSEEILTPENIPKLPVVVPDMALPKTPSDVPLLASDKVIIRETLHSPTIARPEVIKKYGAEAKTTIVKAINDKPNTPNILSKSNKIKTVKRLLVVDKNSGEQKIITSESFEERTPVTISKVVKRSPSIISRGQNSGEKFIILPQNTSPKPVSSLPALTKLTSAPPTVSPVIKKTQKIIFNAQTGTQMIVDDSMSNEKIKQMTTKAKIIQNKVSAEPTGNAVMIITNSQGVQSKIVLTPEHQKVLFSKKPGQLTLTTPQVKNIGMQSSRPKPIAVTSQSIITSRGQIINPISGNALITSTGQLLPAQSTTTSTVSSTIISSSKVIPPGERVIITGKPNQTILTSKGQLIMTQMAPITTHSKISPNINKLSTPNISNCQLASSPTVQKTIMGKPKQTLVKVNNPTIIKSSSKIISGDLATLLQGKKPGTVMHLTAAQFEHLQKTGQIVQQPSLTHIVQAQKGKQPIPQIQQSQKIIVQKQTATLKQPTPIVEKKVLPAPTPRSISNIVQTKIHPPSPPKKHKLRELLSTGLENSQAKKKKPVATYSSPAKHSVDPKPDQVMDLGNLDELIPATTISTRKGEVSISESNQLPLPANIVEAPTSEISGPISEINVPSTSLQPQDALQADPNQQIGGGLADGQLLAVPGENFGGPPNSFYLCVEENGKFTPIDNQPLVLENNQLVPMVIPPVLPEFLNTEDQILVDQQTLLSLLGGNSGDRLVTGENQQLLLQGDVRQLMAALTPQAPPNQDILAAALADTDVFQSDALVPETLGVVTGPAQGMLVEMDTLGSEFQNLNAAVTVHSNVETSTTLKQPIMSPVEIPSKKRIPEDLPNSESIEESLAVIGVTPPSVPSSLDLPITVTDPRIAPKTTNPLSLTCGPLYAPPTLVLAPTPATIDPFTSSLLTEHKTTGKSYTGPIQSAHNTISKKSESTVPAQANKKQQASSMPCLDDSSSDSFASENPQQLTEAIQTKTYSPISMPLLTDDPVPAEHLQEVDTTSTQQPVKSMPVLLDSEDITSSSNIGPSADTSMPLLEDDEDHCKISKKVNKVQTINDLSIPNSQVLPNEIFNESCSGSENPDTTTIDEGSFSPEKSHPAEVEQADANTEVHTDTSVDKVDPNSGQDASLIPASQNSTDLISHRDDNNENVIVTDTPEENVTVSSAGDDLNTEIVSESEFYVTENTVVSSVEEVVADSVDKEELEPADGIPIIVTTEDTEAGGVVVDVDLDVAPPSVPSPTDGNSLPHAEGEEPFSDASSDASTEIPLQPPISISQHSLSSGRNGDNENKRAMTPNSLDLSPKKFKYDDER